MGGVRLYGYMLYHYVGVHSLGQSDEFEIIGKVTDVPWAFVFYDVDTYPRHPGQLYEAIAYFVFFWVIFLIYRKYPKKSGYRTLLRLMPCAYFHLPVSSSNTQRKCK